jgi:starch-binding outer membrane protein, SusD/RagB family
MKKLNIALASLFLLGLASCSNDSLDPKILDQKDISTNPISSVSDLRMVVNGAYKYMSSVSYYGRDYVVLNEVHSDNAVANNRSGRFVTESSFTTVVSGAMPNTTWAAIYQVIAQANIAINANVTGSAADAVKAEAYALRALAHFDLMKLYGQQNVTQSLQSLTVPYVTQYGVVTQENVDRLTYAELQAKVYEDIDTAISLANANVTVKTKLNIQSIHALKARFALYFAAYAGDAEYATALQHAEKAIGLGGKIATSTEFVSIFEDGEVGVNSIFDIQFLDNDNLGNNSLFMLYQLTNYGDIVPTTDLKEKVFANPADIRGKLITLDTNKSYRMTGKYVFRADNVKVIRVEEMYLTAAEAAFRAGDVTLATEYVNKVVTNRGVAAYSNVSLEDIITERQREFAFEGFRFDDLMRLKRDIPQVNGRATTNTPAYGDYRLAFPIPRAETNVSPIQQNQGYL